LFGVCFFKQAREGFDRGGLNNSM